MKLHITAQLKTGMAAFTKASFKSFIRKALAEGNLWIRVVSNFDGMEDGVRPVEQPFKQVQDTNAQFPENSLGIQGLWLVGGGGDYFKPYSDATFEGVEVYNSCGSCILAKKVSQGK